MIDEKQLREDLLAAKQAFAYAKGFRLRLLRKDKLTSFLVYLVENGRQFPVRVELSDYPLVHFPQATFVREIPPCPLHKTTAHPNVRSDQSICFGSTCCLPGMTITGFLNTLYAFLHTANHDSPCRRCVP